jgi:methyl-accepting chemotaxis protein
MSLKAYRHWPILAKIMTIPLISFLVILLAVELFILPFMARQVMAHKQNGIRQAVEVAYGVIEDYARKAKEGKLSAEDAQTQTKEALKLLRYSGKEYFWINDLGKPVPKMIMHPTIPALDGKVLDDAKFNKATSLREGVDGAVQKLDNKNLFVAFNESVAKNGHGFVSYEWPKPKAGGGVTDELFTKLSYVKKFEPWGWVVGSGVYVDDVAAEVNALRWWVHGASLSFALFLLLLGWGIGRGITRPLREVVGHLNNMATGDADLTQRLDVKREDESGELATAFNNFLENLQKIINMVMENATRVAQSSAEMRLRASEMVTSADRVAAEAITVATASEEMAATSNDIASNCVRAVESSHRTSNLAQDGAQVVNGTIAVMDRIAGQVRASAATVGTLGQKSDQIGAIVGTIQDIADQTNLLALNAAIEAARAGEQGRGFAVVADEVRALAERTTKATREIGDMIKAIQQETLGAVDTMNKGVKEVHDGTSEAARSGEALGQILAQVDEVTQQINQIATAAEEQTATTAAISGNIGRITSDATNSSQYALDTVKVAEEMNRLAEALISAVDRFRTIIRWNDRMSVHVRQFDEQHKKLVAMVQQLNDAMRNGEGQKVIGDILSGLAEYTVSHFAQEEKFMQQHNYPEYAEHKKIHDALLKQVGETIVAFENGRAVPAAIMAFLSDWLLNHIMKVDRKYGEFALKKKIS